MFRHNLTLALRNQLKNKVFSIINVLGLAIGLSVSILIINYVSFEFSYDNMHTKRDRIYRVESRFYEGNILTDDWATSTFGYGSAINREMTGVENFVRIGVQNSEQTVSYKEIRSRENGIAYTGPSFFSVFDFKLKEGAINDQLVRPNTVVITEEVALRFFKDENPIGKVLTFAMGTTFYNCEVTGILKNFPKNSHIRFNYLISYETLPVWMKDFWYLHEAYTYLLLVPGKNPKEIESQFPAMAEKYKTMNALKNKTWAVNLVPLKDIHLNPQKQYEREIKGNKKSLITLIFIAIVQFEGYLHITKKDLYYLWITSDDGSKTYLNNQLLFDNDGLHSSDMPVVKLVPFNPGYYPVRIDYFEKTGDQSVTLGWVTGTKNMQPAPLPKEMLFYKE